MRQGDQRTKKIITTAAGRIKNPEMESVKTGAVICKKTDEENGMTYRALVFIKNIPAGVTDAELKSKISLPSLPASLSSCDEIFFRSDIHATTNEVQEQFEHLHPADEPVPEINYREITSEITE
jgi:hypothetical protein